MTTNEQKKVDASFIFNLHFLYSKFMKKKPFSFILLLTVQSRESGAFQDTKIVFDFIGISSKAVEQVMMVPRIQMSLFVKGDGSRRARIVRRDVTHRVPDHSQQLHLRQQIIDFSRLMMYPHRNVNTE